jgi:hypothetical protein
VNSFAGGFFIYRIWLCEHLQGYYLEADSHFLLRGQAQRVFTGIILSFEK